MARKDLLKGLMGDLPKADETATPPESEPKATPAPRYSKGAIGAVSQSIAELKSRALIEVDPRMIDNAGLRDRLGEDDAAHEALKASLSEYGQQVPVLLRHDPNVEGRYQVVYGRRRVAALKDLGIPVKAMLRDLNDRDLIIAQGQENAARRDLTFIEKANFARQMRAHGFDRKVICDALHIDKTVISRMLSVADAIPVKVIEAVGAAPAAGRDRWRTLADAIADKEWSEAQLLAAVGDADGSDARFETLLGAVTAAKPKAPAPADEAIVLTPASGGKPLARAKRNATRLTLTFDRKTADGFEDWLLENITEIHRDWKARTGE